MCAEQLNRPAEPPQLPTRSDFKLGAMGEKAVLVRLMLPDGLTSFKQIDQPTRLHRLKVMRSLETRLEQSLSGTHPDWKWELVTSYDTILLTFDPLNSPVTASAIQAFLESELASQVVEWQTSRTLGETKTGRLHRIGVYYGGQAGPDLERVATLNRITPEELIELHTGTIYTSQVIGFAPGFAYLGDLPPGLVAPRLPQPRPRVPGGTVAMAAGLTGVYPFDLPGGWNLIGATPFTIFDITRQPPIRFVPGDRVQFYRLTEKPTDTVLDHW